MVSMMGPTKGRTRPRRGWRWGALGLLLAGLAGVAVAATQGPVVVLRSSDLAPYLAVQNGFSAELGSAVRLASVKDTPPDQLGTLLQQASVVFAIGPEASAAVEQHGHAKVIRALVSKAGGAAVPLYASPERQARTLRALLPDAHRVGVVYDPAQSQAVVNSYAAAARGAGLELVRKPVHARQEVAGAARELVGEADAIWLVPDVTVVSADTFKFMIELSLENKLPVVGFSAGMAKAGALLVVEATYPEMGRKAAQAAKRMLAGADVTPQAADGAIYLNARTAELLGISLPADLRDRAAGVFQ